MKPLKFNALLKQTLWGGDKIIPVKNLNDKLENVGESWEISGVKGNETFVTEGEFAGKSLNDVVVALKANLVGKANYERFGNEFPLLI
ncbi:MAG: mannose-6-phosphate isomerase, partial [Prevotella sp.]|nr:mannose-6-phosphate isomerase [Prevotella sp.]